ncbi:hypothetical protein GCM10023085_78220 [Actinomadura viridis]|uniref:Uncharacterized protein n=1 Tax=Actinomadura viridis TaxID=58110 RepID=A0A931GKL2_9ACTN|nr:hypothetical protein [Actinomadura viridis]MBG6090275.1 hypothetical protein [Actinomadura viridis]
MTTAAEAAAAVAGPGDVVGGDGSGEPEGGVEPGGGPAGGMAGGAASGTPPVERGPEDGGPGKNGMDLTSGRAGSALSSEDPLPRSVIVRLPTVDGPSMVPK